MNPLLHIPPPVYALLTLGICQALAGLLPMPVDLSLPWLGMVLGGLGLALVFWAWLHFFRQKTTPIPTGEPSALVADGPYRYTRNPMYVGLLILLVSSAFFLGSPVYLLSPFGFYWIIDRLFIPYEEAKLARLFGAKYEALRLQTKRWW
jgi:protein-S-isoprenylcysteine O-methyltransferase Ste14